MVFDTAGRVVAHHAVEYPLLTPTPAAAEQDPDEIHRAVLTAIQAAVRKAGAAPGDVVCVAFSAAMHSLIAVDADGRPPARPCTA